MDQIQRKLILIDKQLAGQKIPLQKLLQTSPLLFAAIGLITGILIQNIFSLPVLVWLIILAVFAAATILFFTIQIRRNFTPYALVLLCSCALTCFTCLGAVRLTSFNQAAPNNIRNLVGNEQTLATIRGLIVTSPYTNRNPQWQFAKFTHADPVSSFYLKIYQVKTPASWAKATGTVRVQVKEPILDLKPGDYIQAYCWLDRFKQATNPGQFDIAKYLERKNIFIAASVPSRDSIELLKDNPKNILTKIKQRLRQTAAQALLSELPPQSPSRGLLEALLLGYRKNVDSSTYRAFQKTGLLHFISLSGLHFGILIAIIWWLCKTAGLSKPARAAVCLIATAVFLMIVPPRAPTLRATVICCVFCLSFFFRRHSNPLNTLSLAAIILLLISPTQIFEVGWQLSFTTVLGILLFREKIENFLHEKTGCWFQTHPTEKNKFTLRLIKKIAAKVIPLFSVGLAAWTGGAGILLYHFHTITPLASIWTILVFPLVAAILTLGFLKIILFFILPTLSAALGTTVTIISDWLTWFVKLLAHLDFSEILIGHVSLAPIISYYGIILFTAFVYFRRPIIKKVTCTLMALAIIVFLGTTKWQRTHRDNLILTCLDVGHGQTILAQLPGKTNCLFDAGSLNKNDIGRRILIPFFSYNGTNKIDHLIISHNDIDHINGIPEIAEYYGAHDIYANDAFFEKADDWGTAKFLKNRLLEKNIEVQPLKAYQDLNSPVKISFLWPNSQTQQNFELSDNDSSLVTLIEYAGRKILLCSDIEKFAQNQLLQIYPNLKADVVIVPHHGSDKTLNPDFLKALNADILIYSCGRRIYEKQQTIKPQNKTRSFHTPRDGAITIQINKDGTITSRCVNQ